jgi:hypothetical protein
MYIKNKNKKQNKQIHREKDKRQIHSRNLKFQVYLKICENERELEKFAARERLRERERERERDSGFYAEREWKCEKYSR